MEDRTCCADPSTCTNPLIGQPITDYQTLSRSSTAKVEVGDIYLIRDAVYRIAIYDETTDRVQMTTSNEVVTDPGWIDRRDMEDLGFCLCPIELREAATQIFELEEIVSQASKKALSTYRYKNMATYMTLRLPELLPEIENKTGRIFRPPDDQVVQFPELKGKTVTLPSLFYSISRTDAGDRFNRLLAGSASVAQTSAWRSRANRAKFPIIYVPYPFP